LKAGDPGRPIEEFDRHRLFWPKQGRGRACVEALETCAEQRLPGRRCVLDEEIEVAEVSQRSIGIEGCHFEAVKEDDGASAGCTDPFEDDSSPFDRQLRRMLTGHQLLR
jgi:hypothetical protein